MLDIGGFGGRLARAAEAVAGRPVDRYLPGECRAAPRRHTAELRRCQVRRFRPCGRTSSWPWPGGAKPLTVVTSCNDVPVAAASASVARSSRAQSVSIITGRVDSEADAAVNTRLRQQQRSTPSAGRLMAAAVRTYAAMRRLCPLAAGRAAGRTGESRTCQQGCKTRTPSRFMEKPVTHTYGFSTFDLLPGRVLPCYGLTL